MDYSRSATAGIVAQVRGQRHYTAIIGNPQHVEQYCERVQPAGDQDPDRLRALGELADRGGERRPEISGLCLR